MALVELGKVRKKFPPATQGKHGRASEPPSKRKTQKKLWRWEFQVKKRSLPPHLVHKVGVEKK